MTGAFLNRDPDAAVSPLLEANEPHAGQRTALVACLTRAHMTSITACGSRYRTAIAVVAGMSPNSLFHGNEVDHLLLCYAGDSFL
jgi:hypothetical protein